MVHLLASLPHIRVLQLIVCFLCHIHISLYSSDCNHSSQIWNIVMVFGFTSDIFLCRITLVLCLFPVFVSFLPFNHLELFHLSLIPVRWVSAGYLVFVLLYFLCLWICFCLFSLFFRCQFLFRLSFTLLTLALCLLSPCLESCIWVLFAKNLMNMLTCAP